MTMTNHERRSRKEQNPRKEDESDESSRGRIYSGSCACRAIEFQFQAPSVVAFESDSDSKTFPQLCILRRNIEFLDRGARVVNCLEEIPFLVKSTVCRSSPNQQNHASSWYMCQSCGMELLADVSPQEVMVLNLNCIQHDGLTTTAEVDIISIPVEIIEQLYYRGLMTSSLDSRSCPKPTTSYFAQRSSSSREEEDEVEEKGYDTTLLAWTPLGTTTMTTEDHHHHLSSSTNRLDAPSSSSKLLSDMSSNSSTCSSSQLSTASSSHSSRAGVNQVLLMKDQMERYLKVGTRVCVCVF